MLEGGAMVLVLEIEGVTDTTGAWVELEPETTTAAELEGLRCMLPREYVGFWPQHCSRGR